MIEPMTSETQTDRLADVLDAIANAYEAGCQDVHDNYQPDRDPDFSEAARDYAKNVELPATQSLSTDLDKAQQRIAELEAALRSIVRDWESNNVLDADDWQEGYDDGLGHCAGIARAAIRNQEHLKND